jgi:dihydrofolate synthase/folylpolyglutamate synthase
MTDKTLDEWLAHLETLHPKAIDLGLSRVALVGERLGLSPVSPGAKTITVAGTNGKGSCVALITRGLMSQGMTVGTYTSPHLCHYHERIAINGEPVADNDILMAFRVIDEVRKDITLSYFEFSTLAALWLFHRAQVDWQVLEVGLGGRLDAVNIIDADVAVITSIGLDHQEWLGDSRELIAIEKAGIARSGQVCVVAEPDPPATLLPELEWIGAEVYAVQRDWFVEGQALRVTTGQTVDLPAPGGLLPINVAAALRVLALVGVDISGTACQHALATCTVPGRRQHMVLTGRDVLLDVAHNTESVAQLCADMTANPVEGRTLAVFAAMKDKPLEPMLALLTQHVDEWHLPTLGDLSRAAPVAVLQELLSSEHAYTYENPKAAWDSAWSSSKPGDRIVVLGSFVTVGALLPEVLARVDAEEKAR